MRILLFSFYFHPDLCAGSFRCTALVEQLKYFNVDVDVITTQPNRYVTFRAAAENIEHDSRVTIHRIKLPSHRSGMIDQMKAFATYYRQALEILEKKDYDCVFATSSRLFTAFLAARVARKRGLPLYLDIRDIFVDTIKDVLPDKVSKLATPLFKWIESYTFSSACRINLVSKGFADYFQERYPKAEYRWFTNGIDEEFIEAAVNKVKSPRLPNEPLTVLYAGNIGEGQGLHTIIPGLACALGDDVKFLIIGDGGRKKQLEDALMGITNVELRPPVNRQQLISEYQEADVLFLHLNDYPAFTKVLPSKIFEYAALGKPVWAGVAGFPAEFLHKEVLNSAVFRPGDTEQAIKSFSLLEVGHCDRAKFIEKFARKNIMKQMAEDIIEFSSRDSGHE